MKRAIQYRFWIGALLVICSEVLLILSLLTFSDSSAQNMSQMGRVADPQQPYPRADFERECIKMAPKSEPERRKWIARCKHEAP